MALEFLRRSAVEIVIAWIGLILMAVSIAMYLAARPRIDLILALTPLTASITIIIAEYLSGKTRIDLTPIGSIPAAYTIYYMTIEYLRQVREPETLSYSILLGSTIAIITLTVTLQIRRPARRHRVIKG